MQNGLIEALSDFKVLCLSIVLLPLLAAIVAGLLGKQIGRNGAHRVTIFAVGLSCLLSLWVFTKVVIEDIAPLEIPIYNWGKSDGGLFQIGFLIDRLTVLMISVVSFVSWMVHIYTVGYMKEDPGYQRFFSYISLFTFGMLMLVMSNNFLQLFFGWEMVGLMSYLLIGFWFKKETATLASLKAFIVNRVGDFGFILGIAGIFYYFGTLDYVEVFSQIEPLALSGQTLALTPHFSVSVVTVICLCLFVGAMGKSAQIPLHIWLPDSMEGPTPISALIHAATMVTAGVFMLARLSPLFEYSEVALNFVLVIGGLTCLLMGLVGIVQNDIKRIIAYSTLSQLGYMMTAMGVSAYPIGIFHLMTHAFFKALLFLGAGSVILALHHEQDIWKMGNLKKYMPITYITMLIGSLALIGFPLFSGYYSKDLIVEAVALSTLSAAPMVYVIVVGGVFITALYTFRLFFVVFHGPERFSKQVSKHLHESPAVVWLPLVLLAIPSIIAGFCFIDPLFQDYFKESIVMHPSHASFLELKQEYPGVIEFTKHGFESLPFWLGIAGILISWLAYVRFPSIPGLFKKKLSLLYSILNNKFGFDAVNRWVIAAGTRKIGWFFWRFGDQWFIDGMGVNGFAHTVGRLSGLLRRVQTGYLYHYAFAMISGFLILLVWLILTE
jgi:NADH-quinone oxidoreductase subunit L